MKIVLTNKQDVLLGVFIYAILAFILPLVGCLLISPNLSINILVTTLTGYYAWFMLWHYSWFIVDVLLRFPTYRFLFGCIRFLMCDICPKKRQPNNKIIKS